MKDMHIHFEEPKISVNGRVFTVQRSDAEIMEDMIRLDAQIAKARGTAHRLEEKRGALLSYLDTLLGEGAQEALVTALEAENGGRSIGAASAAKMCEALISAAGQAYAGAFRISYGEDA